MAASLLKKVTTNLNLKVTLLYFLKVLQTGTWKK